MLVLIFRFLEESLRSWRDGIVVTRVSATDIFTLSKIAIMHIFLQAFWSHHGHVSSTTDLAVVVLHIGICNVLSMDTTATIDHG